MAARMFPSPQLVVVMLAEPMVNSPPTNMVMMSETNWLSVLEEMNRPMAA